MPAARENQCGGYLNHKKEELFSRWMIRGAHDIITWEKKMKVCMPVEEDRGLESSLYGHFGSAPGFLLYDTDSGELTPVANRNDHNHGSCNPMASFAGIGMDFLVVAGIGGGALMKLNQAGIRVFQAAGPTVRDNIEALTSRGLAEFSLQHTCQGHGGGCAH